MSWTLVKRWLAAIPERNAVRDLLSPAPTLYSAAGFGGRFEAQDREQEKQALRARAPGSSDRTRDRERMWRRRALLRKGALLYSKVTLTGTFISLAMLDEEGVVVGWYESANNWHAAERSPMQAHVSQFYTAEDTALGVPMADLCTATIHGESVQTGWRMGIDGRKFWATTTIRAVLLRDGRLQGFSHLTERLPTPSRIASMPTTWPWKWPFNTAPAYELPRRASGPPPSSALFAFAPRIRSSGAAAFVAAALAVALPVAAAEAARAMPPNARASEFGSGWDCERGYERMLDRCEPLKVPAHAYLDASGSRWRCERGYISVERACAPIKVPANAYLDESYGTGWRCDRRYRESKGACVLIQIPANAHEVDSSYGQGWACDRGYALRSGSCQAVLLPANAFLSRSGEEWKCDRGFAESNGDCAVLAVPAHGYVDMQGNDWICERGFQKTGFACEAITVPANAHLDDSGNNWRCNAGFAARAGSCVED